MASALQDLAEFETHADAAVAKLPLWRLPVRSLLSLVYLFADGQYVGGRFTRKKSRRDDDVGTAIITRMSYVMHFLEQGTREIGANIDDALSVFDEGMRADIEHLLGYGRLCEIMPLARRAFFSVESTTFGFRLQHPNQYFAKHEETDILLSEIARTG